MKTLTQDQIDAVVDWMNNWAQLKYTVIPIRFKEDWTKQLNIPVIVGQSEQFNCFLEDSEQGERCETKCKDCKDYKGVSN